MCTTKIRCNCGDKIILKMLESQKGTDFRPSLQAVTHRQARNRYFFVFMKATCRLAASNCVFLNEIYALHAEKLLNKLSLRYFVS